MTQPSLLTAFDTSLIAVDRSFSSTETNTSIATSISNEEHQPHHVSNNPNMDNNELYERWAGTYDSDGNPLLVVDDLRMLDLIPAFVVDVQQGKESLDRRLKIMDLGCGTGRNTVKLLRAGWDHSVDLVAWDVSKAMLAIAQSKCDDLKKSGNSNAAVAEIEFDIVDFADLKRFPTRYHEQIDGLISTLVVEHLPLDVYFHALNSVLRPGGIALVTNMHEIMGNVTQAGFTSVNGDRLKGVSYAHTANEIIEAARMAGFEVMGPVQEAALHAAMIDGGQVDGQTFARGTVRETARRWVGKNVWCGFKLKKPVE
ncbi:S-adenosyl-L-methionine-dependent methyltransferase [Acrodontium crateriforme]|uniref:S-adenosyl-L-methionine-dependent methyltransferase n=1 Tax=Acrodontium crateriforme TaxID=150365 RepID=A0AAQ3R5P4_9PEZI|nr:S-adenosyl-L-methionine-dependent methyltransferase [Acrodontium crateriforme]